MQPSTVQSGFANINGTQIYYEVAGQGHPLILTHAAIADHRMWDDQFAEFAKSYRVVRWDMRGFGQSPIPDIEFQGHEDLHALLQYLNIEKAHIIGVSAAAGVVTDFALAYPDMVTALILVAGTPVGYEMQPTPEEEALWHKSQELLKKGDKEAVVELDMQTWVDGFNRIKPVDPKVRERVKDMHRNNQKYPHFDERKWSVLKPYAGTRLDEIHVPMLVIVGDKDVPSLVGATADIASKIKGAKYVVIPDTAHLPNMEKPAEFNKIVLDFLKGVK